MNCAIRTTGFGYQRYQYQRYEYLWYSFGYNMKRGDIATMFFRGKSYRRGYLDRMECYILLSKLFMHFAMYFVNFQLSIPVVILPFK